MHTQDASLDPQLQLGTTKTLLSLPAELLAEIFSLIGKRDVISVSMANRRHRGALLPFVFRRIYIPWSRLEEFVNHFAISKLLSNADSALNSTTPSKDALLDCSKLQDLVSELEIYQSDNKLEWHLFNLLDLLVANLSRLDLLKITVSSSSFCLKYFTFKSGIKHLHLKTDRMASIFYLEHVRQFKSIQRLVLENFRFLRFNRKKLATNFENDSGNGRKGQISADHNTTREFGSLLPSITNLKLVNCSWDYPFGLEEFVGDHGDAERLESIMVVYTADHSFLLSERFKQYLSFPDIAPLLRSFTLDVTDNSEFVRFANIEAYLAIEKLQGMREVRLLGVPFQDCGFLELLLAGNTELQKLEIVYGARFFNSKEGRRQMEQRTAACVAAYQEKSQSIQQRQQTVFFSFGFWPS